MRPGYLGRLRKKSSTPVALESWQHSWKRRLTIKHNGSHMSWLLCFKEPFRFGCFVCQARQKNTIWGRCDAKAAKSAVQLQNFLNHAAGKCHRQALQELQSCVQIPQAIADGVNGGAPEPELDDGPMGVVSTLNAAVPRLDRWVEVLELLADRVGYARQKTKSKLGGLLPGGDGDSSARVCRQMYQCLRGPLDDKDLQCIRRAKACSLAIDKGDGHLVVYCRMVGPFGIYECLLGIDSDCEAYSSENAAGNVQPDASRAVLEGLKRVCERACTVRAQCRREQLYKSDKDALDEQALAHLRAITRTAVADGGPCEQRALYESGPDAPTLRKDAAAAVMFPRLQLISRDACHRYRSVDKMFMSKVPSFFKDFMSKLVLGERSLAKLLETSDKVQNLFLQKQQASAREQGPIFARFLKSFSFADHRYDSRKKPLYRLFRLLPVCIDVLEEIASHESGFDDSGDQALAIQILKDMGGDEGYCRLVGSAVCCDALLVAWPFLKVCDKNECDFALSAGQASECLSLMQQLFKEGSLFLPDCKDTLTHSVLTAIQGRMLFAGRGGRKAEAIPMRWPAPQSEARRHPIEVAKKSLDIFFSRNLSLVDCLFRARQAWLFMLECAF